MPHDLVENFGGREQDNSSDQGAPRAGAGQEGATPLRPNGVVDVANEHVGIDDDRWRRQHAAVVAGSNTSLVALGRFEEFNLSGEWWRADGAAHLDRLKAREERTGVIGLEHGFQLLAGGNAPERGRALRASERSSIDLARRFACLCSALRSESSTPPRITCFMAGPSRVTVADV